MDLNKVPPNSLDSLCYEFGIDPLWLQPLKDMRSIKSTEFELQSYLLLAKTREHDIPDSAVREVLELFLSKMGISKNNYSRYLPSILKDGRWSQTRKWELYHKTTK